MKRDRASLFIGFLLFQFCFLRTSSKSQLKRSQCRGVSFKFLLPAPDTTLNKDEDCITRCLPWQHEFEDIVNAGSRTSRSPNYLKQPSSISLKFADPCIAAHTHCFNGKDDPEEFQPVQSPQFDRACLPCVEPVALARPTCFCPKTLALYSVLKEEYKPTKFEKGCNIGDLCDRLAVLISGASMAPQQWQCVKDPVQKFPRVFDEDIPCRLKDTLNQLRAELEPFWCTTCNIQEDTNTKQIVQQCPARPCLPLDPDLYVPYRQRLSSATQSIKHKKLLLATQVQTLAGPRPQFAPLQAQNWPIQQTYSEFAGGFSLARTGFDRPRDPNGASTSRAAIRHRVTPVGQTDDDDREPKRPRLNLDLSLGSAPVDQPVVNLDEVGTFQGNHLDNYLDEQLSLALELQSVNNGRLPIDQTDDRDHADEKDNTGEPHQCEQDDHMYGRFDPNVPFLWL